MTKPLFCNSEDAADSNGNTELPVTCLTFVKYIRQNGGFWNVLFVFRKTAGVTLSTKYAEKDGVGGFAPSAFNATPSGLDPGGDLGSCSKSWWWRDRKEVVGGEWKKSCGNSKICHRKIGCFDINYFEKRNMKNSHFSLILPSLRVILMLMALPNVKLILLARFWTEVLPKNWRNYEEMLGFIVLNWNWFVNSKVWTSEWS